MQGATERKRGRKKESRGREWDEEGWKGKEGLEWDGWETERSVEKRGVQTWVEARESVGEDLGGKGGSSAQRQSIFTI